MYSIHAYPDLRDVRTRVAIRFAARAPCGDTAEARNRADPSCEIRYFA